MRLRARYSKKDRMIPIRIIGSFFIELISLPVSTEIPRKQSSNI